MLRITIELVPGGQEYRAEVIGRGHIANISHLAELSDYTVKFEEHAWRGRERGPYVGTLKRWPRNERGVWEILSAALQAVLPGPTSPKKRRYRRMATGR